MAIVANDTVVEILIALDPTGKTLGVIERGETVLIEDSTGAYVGRSSFERPVAPEMLAVRLGAGFGDASVVIGLQQRVDDLLAKLSSAEEQLRVAQVELDGRKQSAEMSRASYESALEAKDKEIARLSKDVVRLQDAPVS